MELEKRISELQEFIYRKRFHEKKLEEANMEYIYIKEKKNEMYLKLEDEDVNIRSIENKSIIYLWYDLFTSKGKTISKTMHEYKIFFDLTELLHSEILDIKNKINKTSEYEEEYSRLLLERDQIVLESEKDKYSNIEQLEKECIKYKNHIRELNESINASNHLKKTLKYIIDLVSKSKNWDNFDIFGRGLFVTLTKTSYFKQAEEMAKHFHYYVNKCIRELKVVNFYMDLKINYQELKAFSDYYLTDLYDDICDKKRIFNIIEKINKGYELVNVMISDLSLQKEDYLQQLIQLEGKKRALLK